MPSAYVLAKDSLQQAQAILANEVWHDDQIAHLLEQAIARLAELDRVAGDERPFSARPDPGARLHWLWARRPG